jgi:hypothetical protein
MTNLAALSKLIASVQLMDAAEHPQLVEGAKSFSCLTWYDGIAYANPNSYADQQRGFMISS